MKGPIKSLVTFLFIQGQFGLDFQAGKLNVFVGGGVGKHLNEKLSDAIQSVARMTENVIEISKQINVFVDTGPVCNEEELCKGSQRLGFAEPVYNEVGKNQDAVLYPQALLKQQANSSAKFHNFDMLLKLNSEIWTESLGTNKLKKEPILMEHLLHAFLRGLGLASSFSHYPVDGTSFLTPYPSRVGSGDRNNTFLPSLFDKFVYGGKSSILDKVKQFQRGPTIRESKFVFEMNSSPYKQLIASLNQRNETKYTFKTKSGSILSLASGPGDFIDQDTLQTLDSTYKRTRDGLLYLDYNDILSGKSFMCSLKDSQELKAAPFGQHIIEMLETIGYTKKTPKLASFYIDPDYFQSVFPKTCI